MACGNAVLDIVLGEGFLDHVQKMSLLLKQKLASLGDRYPDVIESVRGEGLLIGIKTKIPNGDFVLALRNQKMLSVAAGDNVVRLLPPLIIDEHHVESALENLEKACKSLSLQNGHSQTA